MSRRRLVLAVAAVTLWGTACAVDNLWLDRLTVTVAAPATVGMVEVGETREGLMRPGPGCPPATGYETVATLTPGTHDLEIESESDYARSSVLIRAWEELDGDDYPSETELGVCEWVDLEEVSEVTLPREDAPVVEGGGRGPCH